MAAPRGEAGSARGVLVGSGLLALGALAGILAGALLDAPRILLHRLQGPVYSADLETGEIVSDADEAAAEALADVSQGAELEEFAALQEDPEPAAAPPQPPAPAPAAPRSPPAAAKPAAAKPAAAKPAAAKPKEPRTVAAREPRPPDEPDPAELIRRIAERTESPSPPPAQPPAREAQPEPKPEPVERESVPAAPQPRPGPVVQVGAFGSPADAEAAAQKLRKLGFDSYVSDKRAAGPYQHRVRVRPNGTGAKALADELKRRGYDVWITRE